MSSLPSVLHNSGTQLAPLALIAGRGELPCNIIESCSHQGRPLHIIAIEGQTEMDIVGDLPHLWCGIGELGKVFDYLKSQNIKDVVMAGHMTRPSLRHIKTDWVGKKVLAKIMFKALGDDGLLRAVIGAFEDEGFRLIGAQDLLGDILAPMGVLGIHKADDQAEADIARGVEILKSLSHADVGQAVVIQQGLVLAVEAIEGTDEMIKRAGSLQREGTKGVVVKLPKVQQELRVDLPTVGVQTIERIVECGLTGLAVEAGHTLMLNQQKMIEMADANGIFIIGIKGLK